MSGAEELTVTAVPPKLFRNTDSETPELRQSSDGSCSSERSSSSSKSSSRYDSEVRSDEKVGGADTFGSSSSNPHLTNDSTADSDARQSQRPPLTGSEFGSPAVDRPTFTFPDGSPVVGGIKIHYSSNSRAEVPKVPEGGVGLSSPAMSHARRGSDTSELLCHDDPALASATPLRRASGVSIGPRPGCRILQTISLPPRVVSERRVSNSIIATTPAGEPFVSDSRVVSRYDNEAFRLANSPYYTDAAFTPAACARSSVMQTALPNSGNLGGLKEGMLSARGENMTQRRYRLPNDATIYQMAASTAFRLNAIPVDEIEPSMPSVSQAGSRCSVPKMEAPSRRTKKNGWLMCC